jgi:alkylation response protein AidB-like acyl-CoA dehydrogenase
VAGPAEMSSAQSQNLLYSELEDDLRASVRSLLTDRCSLGSVLARCETSSPSDQALWHALAADLGTAGLLIPPDLGGHGASAREAAVVLEELGRTVAPVPFLSSAVLTTLAVRSCDVENPHVADLLGRLATGEAIAALTVPLSTLPMSEFPDGVRADAQGTLSGQVRNVLSATEADVLVVPAIGPDGPGLYACNTDSPAVSITPVTTLDLTRPLADVTFGAVTARQLCGPGSAEPSLRYALTATAGLLASEQLGLAEWCLAETVRYVKERHQFGRPVGSFQAVKHRLADLWLEVVHGRAAARSAADALARNLPGTAEAVAVARSYCSALAVHAAEECIQLHGGIGMTWEHPAHLYLKRAKADQIAFGSPGRHRAHLATLIDLPLVVVPAPTRGTAVHTSYGRS